MSTELVGQFEMNCRPGVLVDSSSTRYALGQVLLVPDGNGDAIYAVSCDGRALAVTRHIGTLDRSRYVSGKVLNKEGEYKLNGNIERITGKNAKKTELFPLNSEQEDKDCGKYPDVRDVMKRVDDCYIALRLDIKLLEKLRQALNSDGDVSSESLTLYIKKPSKAAVFDYVDEHGDARKFVYDTVRGEVTDGVMVEGRHGFGVIMTMTAGVESDRDLKHDGMSDFLDRFDEQFTYPKEELDARDKPSASVA